MTCLTLPWPLDSGLDSRQHIDLPGSNIVLDIHGDPLKAELTVVMEGNQFMVMPDILAAFRRSVGRPVEVLYVTLPPASFKSLVMGHTLAVGNLVLSAVPDVVMGPPDFMADLYNRRFVDEPVTFAGNQGIVLVVPRGNPKGLSGPQDLLRTDIRIATSNPQTERGSYRKYLQAVAHLPALVDKIRRAAVTARWIHHREVPALVHHGMADAALLYAHFARYYAQWQEPLFDALVFSAGGSRPGVLPGGAAPQSPEQRAGPGLDRVALERRGRKNLSPPRVCRPLDQALG